MARHCTTCKLVEDQSLLYIKKKIQNPSVLTTVTWRGKLNMVLLSVSLWLPLKFKAPKIVSESIPDEVDFINLNDRWGNSRTDLRNFLNELSEELQTKKIFRHPRIGMITMPQSLDFFQSHFNHHVPQVKRLISGIKNNAKYAIDIPTHLDQSLPTAFLPGVY